MVSSEVAEALGVGNARRSFARARCSLHDMHVIIICFDAARKVADMAFFRVRHHGGREYRSPRDGKYKRGIVAAAAFGFEVV